MQFAAPRKFIKGNLVLGFTLIELLVVISIIAILTTVATVSYTDAQKKSRDSKRKADMAAIQQALEVFYSDRGAYPDERFSWPFDGYDRFSCNTSGDNVPPSIGIKVGEAFYCDGKTYMNNVPGDPSSGKGYFYEMRERSNAMWCVELGGEKCQEYTLWAHLENENDPDILKTANDLICSAAKIIPPDSSGDDEPAVGDGVYDRLDTNHYDGNYCVHGP